MICHRGISASVQISDRVHRGFQATVINVEMVNDSPMRERTDEALFRLGSKIKVIRAGREILLTEAILSPLQRITSPRTLESIRAGFFKAGDDIQGGDLLLDLKRNDYYIYLAENQYEAEGETTMVRAIVAKCNHSVDVFRRVSKPTGYGGVHETFEKIYTDIPVTIEFIRAGMLFAEAGFFGKSTHRLFIQSRYGITLLDRIRIKEDYFMVDAIDSVIFPNTYQLTLSRDIR